MNYLRTITKRFWMSCSFLLAVYTGGQLASAAVPLNRPAFDVIPFETLGLGTSSGCVRPAKMVISNETEWQRVWNVHQQGQATPVKLPTVDFSKQVVLALLLGDAPTSGLTIEIAQVVYGPSETVVYYYINRDNEKKIADTVQKTQPFHFAALDKPATPIRFVDAFKPVCATCVQ